MALTVSYVPYSRQRNEPAAPRHGQCHVPHRASTRGDLLFYHNLATKVSAKYVTLPVTPNCVVIFVAGF